MTSRDFCYWLQGFYELNGVKSLTFEQSKMISNHLNLVFKHEIDPSIDKHHTPEGIDELNQIHNTPFCSKPTLQELGEKYDFLVHDGGNGHNFGPCPGEGYVLSSLHGWYKESEGQPRC